MSLRFFFYGTLLAPHDAVRALHPAMQGLHDKLLPGGPASTRGRLFAIPDPEGWYPALIPGRGGAVRGRVYPAGPDFGAADLARIDAYEDCRAGDPAGSEYLRRTIAVEPAGGSGPVRATAYCYNQPLPPGAEPVNSGDFHAWLTERGARAYGETA